MMRESGVTAVTAVKRVEAILWDVDGTLSDTFMLGLSATDKVLQGEGKPPISEREYHGGTIYTTPRRFAWHITGP